MKNMKLLLAGLALLIPAVGYGMRRPTRPAGATAEQKAQFLKIRADAAAKIRDYLNKTTGSKLQPYNIISASQLENILFDPAKLQAAGVSTSDILDLAAASGFQSLIVKGLENGLDVSQITKDINQDTYVKALARVKITKKPTTPPDQTAALTQQAKDLANAVQKDITASRSLTGVDTNALDTVEQEVKSIIAATVANVTEAQDLLKRAQDAQAEVNRIKAAAGGVNEKKVIQDIITQVQAIAKQVRDLATNNPGIAAVGTQATRAETAATDVQGAASAADAQNYLNTANDALAKANAAIAAGATGGTTPPPGGSTAGLETLDLAGLKKELQAGTLEAKLKALNRTQLEAVAKNAGLDQSTIDALTDNNLLITTIQATVQV